MMNIQFYILLFHLALYCEHFLTSFNSLRNVIFNGCILFYHMDTQELFPYLRHLDSFQLFIIINPSVMNTSPNLFLTT